MIPAVSKSSSTWKILQYSPLCKPIKIRWRAEKYTQQLLPIKSNAYQWKKKEAVAVMVLFFQMMDTSVTLPSLRIPI